jgi:hypothetical protein
VRIGYYHREKVIIRFKVYNKFPIARYRCNRTGPLCPPHLTFSLLPQPLIPYYSNDVNVAFETVTCQHTTAACLENIKRMVGGKGKNDYLSLENNQIYDFQQLFVQAFEKISAIPVLKPYCQTAATQWGNQHPIRLLLNFIDNYHSPFLTNKGTQVENVAWDFFCEYQPGCYFQRQFLFGTPSQQRH